MMRENRSRRRRVLLLVSGVAVAAVAASGVAWTQREVPTDTRDTTLSEPASAPITTDPQPEADPAPTGFPADPAIYDLAALPAVDARAVVPALAVDSSPDAPVLPLSATPTGPAIAVFAVPGEPPVAQLLREQQYDGTIVPVVERQDDWLKVLLPARSGLPSQGVVGQQTGWVRVADVTVTTNDYAVSVSLSTGELVVTQAGVELARSQTFGYGLPETPTPIGRTFIMTMFTDAAATYTRGLPIVALAVQSPTLDGFKGQNVAVTAFHYSSVHDGAVSNGCVRVDEATIAALAALPLGTPVVITA